MSRSRRLVRWIIAAALVLGIGGVALADLGTPARGASTQSRLQNPTKSTVVPGLVTSTLAIPDLGGGGHRVRVGVLEPSGRPVADLLFLHGHADRLDNHRELFLALARSGIRVISFDFPSHGETHAGPIDAWSFTDFAALAGRVERATRTGDRPLVLAGWSFGGLVATRIAQDPTLGAEITRPLAALVLENPAVAPLTFSGGDGVSKLRNLTHDLRAPVAGPPSPPAPFLDPVFAVRLISQAAIARSTPLPANIKTLVLLSDAAEDDYIDPTATRAWAESASAANTADVSISQCPGSRHGTDFESWPIGAGARADIVDFLAGAVGAHAPAQVDPEVGAACR